MTTLSPEDRVGCRAMVAAARNNKPMPQWSYLQMERALNTIDELEAEMAKVIAEYEELKTKYESLTIAHEWRGFSLDNLLTEMQSVIDDAR